jgi:hypothetical protein
MTLIQDDPQEKTRLPKENVFIQIKDDPQK